MELLGCIFSAVLLQIASAQVIQYPSRNAGPNQLVTNQPMPNQHMTNANANTIRAIPNNGIPRAGNINLVNSVPYMTNNMANNMPNNMQNNMANTMPNNMPHAMPNNMANVHVANVVTEQAIPNDMGGVITNADLANANIGFTSPNIAALANMASINGNMATFSLGNGGFSVTSGSPNSPGFGINVLADALEVGGLVAVNGQIPIYGAVTVNGHLPTDGSASVSYICGGPTPLDGVLN